MKVELNKKFKSGDCLVFEEGDKKCVFLDYYWITKKELSHLYNYFVDYDYRITHEKHSVRFNIYDVPQSFFDELDIEMSANKYNL